MKKLFARTLVSVIVVIRHQAYRRGLRPKQGSLFFSPSLSIIYGLRDFRKQIKRN
jgi:hypothetical protein